MLPRKIHKTAAPGVGALIQCVWLVGIAGLLSCSATRSAITVAPVGPLPPNIPQELVDGELVVYSATHSSTSGQSEYPLHSDYEIRGAGNASVRKVANQAGLFAQDPASVRLSPGEYRVRALVDGGGYVVIPVIIRAGKRTIVDLQGTMMPQRLQSDSRWVTLPNGRVVGWRAHDETGTNLSR